MPHTVTLVYRLSYFLLVVACNGRVASDGRSIGGGHTTNLGGAGSSSANMASGTTGVGGFDRGGTLGTASFSGTTSIIGGSSPSVTSSASGGGSTGGSTEAGAGTLVTYSDSVDAGVSVTVRSLGLGGTTTISVLSDCSMFQNAMADSGTAMCVVVTSTETLIGTATVCLPNASAQVQHIVRCTNIQGACPAGAALYPARSAQACCVELATSATPTRTCGLTTELGKFVQSSAFKDSDGDTWFDIVDNCPTAYDMSQTDSDKDCIGDACDNCPSVPNQDQKDSVGDGVGDACRIDAG